MKSNPSMPTTLPRHPGMEQKSASFKDPMNPLLSSISSSELSNASLQSSYLRSRNRKSARKKYEGYITIHQRFWRTAEILSLLETANSSQSAVRKISWSFGWVPPTGQKMEKNLGRYGTKYRSIFLLMKNHSAFYNFQTKKALRVIIHPIAFRKTQKR